jgi:polar amino acid transport system substrate-binding protein
MTTSGNASPAGALKNLLKDALRTAIVLSLVLLLAAPPLAGALSVDTTTARGNETSTGNVLGGVPTRVTWEAVIDKGESVQRIAVQFPQGTRFTDRTSARITVLQGTERLDPENEVSLDAENACVEVSFAEPLEEGLRVRIETYEVALPDMSAEVSLTGSYMRDDGEEVDLGESPRMRVTSASPAQRIVNWLDRQPWVAAWNSVTVLNLFLKPQLIVLSIPTVMHGWLLSLMLVLIGFPLAIPIGLVAAFMKISKSKALHGLAALYTGVVRGTPLFLQIYIAFFGLPLMGIDPNKYLLAILVLAFNSGAYMCEILRAGIQSIHRGQFEAARSLGMTQAQTMFSVIIPQTVRRVIPTMTSEFILLYKDTSLLAAVGVMELMLYARSVVANTGNMTPYLVAAVFYLIVTLPLIHVVTKLERRMAESDDGGSSPRKTRKNRRGALRQMAEEMGEIGNQEAPGPSGANAAAGAAQKEA